MFLRPLRFEFAICAALLGIWCILAVRFFLGNWAPDISAVYIAGWLWASGQESLIYAVPPGFFGGISDTWHPVLTGLGIADLDSFPFLYPPLWAVIASYGARATGPQQFADLVLIYHVVLLAFCVVLAGRIARPASVSWSAWTLIGIALLSLSTPALHALLQNQPTITVTFLILASVDRLLADKAASAGVLLALAAAIKLTPIVFVLIFVLDRQPKAVVAFGVAGALLAATSVALAGWPLHRAFLDTMAAMGWQTSFGAFNPTLGNALLPLLSALGAIPELQHPTDVVTIPAALGIGLRLATLGFVTAVVFWFWQLPRRERLVLGLTALSIAVPLFGPIGWQHYYVLPLLLAPGAIARMPASRRLVASVVVIVASAFPLYVALRLGALRFTDLALVLNVTGWVMFLALVCAAGRQAQECVRPAPAHDM
ncbi:glycosyltransferase family 87 protein [Pararhodobacter zhoushanensis]|uniref:glycosyltransferase family 87 protein n=1 Tax=Pararhodobacter zhoushanensis TaxID=2479545 RepID=UPI0013DF8771|nr:glycosyltransferase family 87 protein [Pararhodobacter zhoushanensis]